ncbi:regulatory protein RecX [Nesterenkonia ebinurensis]|uniref:regulatory protein RecX n=1 Tax=Nesterenkonia ebinurensis TaxID=2608252 RepID=UPI00123C83F6|nr:regulatory protein RecX [Nesterenkonia ebinurensis]
MSDQKIAALKETLARYQAGELSSDLFDQAPESAAGESRGGHGDALDGDEYAKARAVVLRKLTGSAKSRHQLAQVLEAKEFSEEVIAQVLDRMEEVQLIDDAALARTWVRTRHELKGLGAAALRRELQDKGIAAEHIEAALGQLSAEDEHTAARELIEGKLRGVVVPVGNGAEDRKEREKITRRLVNMLGRRGHSPSAAFQLVREQLDRRAA